MSWFKCKQETKINTIYIVDEGIKPLLDFCDWVKERTALESLFSYKYRNKIITYKLHVEDYPSIYAKDIQILIDAIPSFRKLLEANLKYREKT